MHGENLHQNHTYYSYPTIPTHPHPIMPLNPHHSMPPHLYQSITPHQFFCPYCTSTPKYEHNMVPNYPHIPLLGSLQTSPHRLPSYVLLHHTSNNINEYRKKTRNRRTNEQKKKIRPSMSIWKGEDGDLVSVSVDGPHKELGWQEKVSSLLPKKNHC